MVRNHVADVAELEAQIRANPDDIAARLVYADWLQSQGDPFGELVMLQHQLASAPTAALKKRERAWFTRNGKLPKRCAATWQLGFVRTLRVKTQTAVDPALRALLRGPACRFLHALRIEGPYLGIRAVLSEAPPHLRELAVAGKQVPLDVLPEALELQPELTRLELDTPSTWQRETTAIASPVLAELELGHVVGELAIELDTPALRSLVLSSQFLAQPVLDRALALPLVRAGLFAGHTGIEGQLARSRAWATLEEVGLAWTQFDLPSVERRIAWLGARRILPSAHWPHAMLLAVGQVLRTAKRWDDALRCFELGIAANPDDVRMRLEHGIALGRLGRLAESIASYEHVLKLAPRNYAAHYNLASHLRDTGAFQRGHQMISVACELAPDEPAVWHIRGQLEIRLGRSAQDSLDRALALYRDALAEDDGDANARFQIGCVYQLLGDRATCLRELAAAIALDSRIAETARTDIDLVDLRDDPELVRLLR